MKAFVKDWIFQKRQILKVAWIVLGIICLAIVFIGKNFSHDLNGQPNLILFLASPFFMFGCVHLALMYLKLFYDKTTKTVINSLKRGFFLLFLMAYLFIFIFLFHLLLGGYGKWVDCAFMGGNGYLCWGSVDSGKLFSHFWKSIKEAKRKIKEPCVRLV